MPWLSFPGKSFLTLFLAKRQASKNKREKRPLRPKFGNGHEVSGRRGKVKAIYGRIIRRGGVKPAIRHCPPENWQMPSGMRRKAEVEIYGLSGRQQHELLL